MLYYKVISFIIKHRILIFFWDVVGPVTKRCRQIKYRALAILKTLIMQISGIFLTIDYAVNCKHLLIQLSKISRFAVLYCT